MKKAYSKPDIYFESFALSTDIAANTCAAKNALMAYGTCPAAFGSRTVFLDEHTGCSDLQVARQFGSYNGYCYDIPYESMNVWSS